MSRGANGQIARIRYVLPGHKAANWVGPGRSRKSTRPGANGVVEFSPSEFLDRLAERGLRTREKNAAEAGAGRFEKTVPDARAASPEAHESLISRKTGAEEVPLTGYPSET